MLPFYCHAYAGLRLASNRAPKFASAVVGIGYQRHKGEELATYLVIVFANRKQHQFLITSELHVHNGTIRIKDYTIALRDVPSEQVGKFFDILVKLSKKIKPYPMGEMKPLAQLLKLQPRSTKAVVNMANIKKKDVVHATLIELTIQNIPSAAHLPAQTFACQRLKQLSLVNCNLTKIPRELADLPRTLTSLILNSNRIREIPRWFLSVCQHLKVLELANNQLLQLPSEIAISTSLKRLNLSANKIHSVPAQLCYKMFALAQYEMVDLSLNKLYYLYYFTPPPDSKDGGLLRESRWRTINLYGNMINLGQRFVEANHRGLNIEPNDVDDPMSLRYLALVSLMKTKSLKAIYIDRQTPQSIYDYYHRNVFFCTECVRLKMGKASRSFKPYFSHAFDQSWLPRMERLEPRADICCLSVICKDCVGKQNRN